jgi:RimJ/RimL family protein N-acetyltransferase
MPSIDTARLHLRGFRLDDLDNLAVLLSDADVVRYVGDGQPIGREESENALLSIMRHWDQHGFGRWAVIDKQTQRFAGFGGLRSLMDTPEVVYHLAKAFWGRGLATELGRASLTFGFTEHQFERIVAVAKPENAASVHVMEKIGMQYDRHTSYYDIEVIQYHITRSQFQLDDSPYRLEPKSVG